MKSPSYSRRLFLSCGFLFVMAGSGLAQTDFDLVGYDDLEDYLGVGNVPDGSSVALSIVEGPEPYSTDKYKINVADSQLSGKTITFSPLLDPLTATSWHATNTARYTTGSTWSMTTGSTWSMTPGVTDVYQMGIAASTSTGYFGSDFLRTSVDNQAPLVETRDIQNHSWVYASGSSTIDTIFIRRHDFAVARDNFVSVVGVNNASSVAAGSPTANPNENRNLLSSAYHAISVGRANGSHAWGDTLVPVAGRQRPHIVVDADVTSWSTAIVSSASALLMDGATVLYSGNPSTEAAARDFRVVKSMILAGAVKDGLGPSGDHVWAAVSSSSPLDEVYGAGRLNVLNSYKILEGGRQAASTSSDAATTGWGFESVSSASDDYFYFDLIGDPSYELSISLNWAVELSPGPGSNYNNMSSVLANLTLSVYEASAYSTLGLPIAISNSSIENLEYLFLADLNPGRYAIRVDSTSATSTDYGIAWQAIAIPEASTLGMAVLGFAILSLLRRRRSIPLASS
jgi:hypothetical protein